MEESNYPQLTEDEKKLPLRGLRLLRPYHNAANHEN